ncbi:alpha/beta fold hydrolase [Nocardia terrae]|uniref:alpha/beta fold hydrolase n=1 Tax=Nocardia terrae TaxID=2675851 RepID=UPI002E25C7FC
MLVPGFGLDHRVWDRQVRVLAQRHRVLCVDQRGHGSSDKPIDGYDMDTLAGDLLAVLEQLDVQACTLVGWSFGGQVAFRAAARDSRRIARLALVGSNGVRASRSAEFPFGRLPDQLEQPAVAAECEDRITSRRGAILAGFPQAPSDRVVDWLVQIFLSMPSWAAVECYRTMFRTDLVGDIPRVTLPVLQIIGAADPVHSSKGARWLAERLADAELIEIDRCGHYPMIECPDEFDAALVRFAAQPTASIAG